jgi:meiotically up-regulated gene 157 (Mug157) protein
MAATLAAVGEQVGDQLGEPTAVDVFIRCLARTLRHAPRRLEDGTVFLVTGDIPAMWLRDSSAQLWPYLRFCRDDEELQSIVVGVLARQFRFIITDPYANAFNAAPSGDGHRWDRPRRDPWVWERKYEVDSLCYPLDLAHRFWRATGRVDHFDTAYRRAAQLVVATWTVEQDHGARSPYVLRRPMRRSVGSRRQRTAVTGMTWSGFRPSDDPCRYPYHVPGNLFASAVLDRLGHVAAEILGDGQLADQARNLRGDIDAGIAAHGIVDHPSYGRIYAYEVDGQGGASLMDDANVPSLLATPLLGHAPDAVYQATRRFVLSKDNPYLYAGRFAAGVGSPHTPSRHVWPLALAVAGLTSGDRDEQRAAILTCSRTATGGTMHESFHCDRPQRYTREWFSWADAMYCELVLEYCAIGAVTPPQ